MKLKSAGAMKSLLQSMSTSSSKRVNMGTVELARVFSVCDGNPNILYDEERLSESKVNLSDFLQQLYEEEDDDSGFIDEDDKLKNDKRYTYIHTCMSMHMFFVIDFLFVCMCICM